MPVPHPFDSLVVVAGVANLVGLLFLTTVLAGLQRAFPRPHTAVWALSWLAASARATLGFAAANPSFPGPLRLAIAFASLLAVFLHAGWLALGTHALVHAAEPSPRLRRAALLGPLLLALAATAASLAFPSLGTRMVVRTLASLGVGAAALAAAVALWRRPAFAGAVGHRLTGGALGCYALGCGHEVVLYLHMMNGGRPPAYALYLGFSDLAILTLLGLGSVVSLLEEERTRLRVAEQKFALVFRNSPDAIIVTLPREGGRIVDVNERFERVFGRTREQTVGRTSTELGVLGDAALPEAFLASAPGASATVRPRELELQAAGGARTFSLAAESYEWGGCTYAVWIARDVSERVEAERLQQQLQEQLRRARTMEAMGTLVAGVAHEVRNPLFSISATVDAMDAALRGAGAFSEHALRLRQQVDRLTRLMRDLLDYGRPSQLQRAPMRLETVLRRAERSCAALARERGVRVDVHVAGDVPLLDVDAPRLEQAFENLLANALQHSPGGAVVALRAAFEAGHAPPRVLCTVDDEGPGVPAALRAAIFEPFVSHRKGGTGLGLPIVQRVVEAHGGGVGVGNRDDGPGCRFTVWLPVEASPAASARA